MLPPLGPDEAISGIHGQFSIHPYPSLGVMYKTEVLHKVAKMVRIPEHRTYKMMLRELELFSQVKRWLKGDITQVLTT